MKEKVYTNHIYRTIKYGLISISFLIISSGTALADHTTGHRSSGPLEPWMEAVIAIGFLLIILLAVWVKINKQ